MMIKMWLNYYLESDGMHNHFNFLFLFFMYYSSNDLSVILKKNQVNFSKHL